MSLQAAEAAMDRIEKDEAFARRLKDAGSPDAALEILAGEGFDVTRDDMRDVVVDRFGDQLTKEQLDALAGGIESDPEDLAVWMAGGVATGFTIFAAAAAIA